MKPSVKVSLTCTSLRCSWLLLLLLSFWVHLCVIYFCCVFCLVSVWMTFFPKSPAELLVCVGFCFHFSSAAVVLLSVFLSTRFVEFFFCFVSVYSPFVCKIGIIKPLSSLKKNPWILNFTQNVCLYLGQKVYVEIFIWFWEMKAWVDIRFHCRLSCIVVFCSGTSSARSFLHGDKQHSKSIISCCFFVLYFQNSVCEG